MLLLLKNYVSLHLVPPFAGTSPSLPYTCLFIFSFFSSPKIPRVCCGPESCSWSSANLERSSAFLEIWGGRRHEIGCKPTCKNPQVVYAQPTRTAGLSITMLEVKRNTKCKNPAVNQWLKKTYVVNLKWCNYSTELNETLLRFLQIKHLLLKWWEKQHNALLLLWLRIVMSQENNSR